MFFENDRFCAQIFDIDRFDSGFGKPRVKGRGFGALALRLSGETVLTFRDGSRISSHPGDVTYLPEGLPYDADYAGVSVLAIHFRETAGGATAENYTPRSPEIAHLFEEAYALWQCGTPDARLEATALFYRILAHLSREQHPAPARRDAFESALAILQTEYRDPELSFPKLCERAGLSVSSFRRNFCARYGKPPVKYLNELRLHEARRRLVEGDLSVEAVAHTCGFHDVKYFSRAVKLYFGCTPTELRSV